MIKEGIKFEERYDDTDDGDMVLYFKTPKELVVKTHPEADYMITSIEFHSSVMYNLYIKQ